MTNSQSQSSWEAIDLTLRRGNETNNTVALLLKRALCDPQFIASVDTSTVNKEQCLEISLKVYCNERIHDPAFFYHDGTGIRTTPRAFTEIHALCRGWRPEYISTIVDKILGESYVRNIWVTYGRPIYEVSPALSWVFLNTELSDLTLSEISIPYEACIIRLNTLAPFESSNPVTRKLIQYKPTCILVYTNFSVDNPGIHFRLESFPLEDTDAIMVSTQDIGYLYENSPDKLLKDCVLPTCSIEQRQAFYYAINVLLYASSTASDDVLRATSLPYLQLERRTRKAKGPAKKRFQEQLKKVPPGMVHFLGHNTLIDRKRTVENVEVGDGIKVAVQRKGSFVCGHWHHYWTGKGRTEKIRKLVMPFWRGGPPTDEQLVETHKYMLK